MVTWTAPGALWLLALVPLRLACAARRAHELQSAPARAAGGCAVAAARGAGAGAGAAGPLDQFVASVDRLRRRRVAQRRAAAPSRMRRGGSTRSTPRFGPRTPASSCSARPSATVADTAALRRLAPIDAATSGAARSIVGVGSRGGAGRGAGQLAPGFDAADRPVQRRPSNGRRRRERDRAAGGSARSRIRRAAWPFGRLATPGSIASICRSGSPRARVSPRP